MRKDSVEDLLGAMKVWVEAIMHRSMHQFSTYARDNGLSMSQVQALFHVHKSGACGVSEISEDLGISNAAVSQMLDRLVHGELVERGEDPNDRRAKRVVLTGKGERTLSDLLEMRGSWFRTVAESLTNDERAQSARTLRMLADRAIALQEKEK